MDALTKEFSEIVKRNPQIYESFRKGLLTFCEAVEIIARQAIADNERQWTKEAREALAQRYINAFPEEATRHGATVSNVYTDIESRPEYIIKFLLDHIQS